MTSTASKTLEGALIAFARTAIHDDCQLFVREFVNIEDLDTGTPIHFTLWPKQLDALKAFHDNRLVVVLKARQLGLTWLALAYAVWCLIAKPGFRVVGLSRGENEARELVRRAKFILRHLPSWLCVQGNVASDGRVAWDGSTEQIRFTHPNGEDGAFISFAASQDSGRAFTASLVVIDEWAFQQWAKDIWTAAYPTINRPGGGKVIGLSTGKRGTFFESVWRKARAGANTFFPSSSTGGQTLAGLPNGGKRQSATYRTRGSKSIQRMRRTLSLPARVLRFLSSLMRFTPALIGCGIPREIGRLSAPTTQATSQGLAASGMRLALMVG